LNDIIIFKEKYSKVFRIREFLKPKLKNVILIEGLPGIGSVGKIAVDFMIESLDAKKFMEISSDGFPSSVFVNESNMLDLPKVELFYKKFRKFDIIFVSGDTQPIDERACYGFCNLLLDIFKRYNGKEIITLGGIGLPKIPKISKVYCSGNNKKIMKKYSNKNVEKRIFGTVGPIIGVTGLLIGLAGERNIPATVILAQTFAYPAYLGVSGAKKILNVLNEKLGLRLKMNDLNKGIKDMKKEIELRKKLSIKYKKKKMYPVDVTSDGASYIG